MAADRAGLGGLFGARTDRFRRGARRDADADDDARPAGRRRNLLSGPARRQPDRYGRSRPIVGAGDGADGEGGRRRSEEHTSELQSLMRISYAVFCLKKKKNGTSVIGRTTRAHKS